jgi:ribonuclease E
MTQRILIDAIHPDEVRVAVAEGNALQEFDFENVAKKQIKSNIYLGKITRVEPSLQAAFVEYGGNRQGFLPFSEVHFDYFQIPVADKERILAEIEAEEAARAPEDDEDATVEGDATDISDKADAEKADDSKDADSKPAEDKVVPLEAKEEKAEIVVEAEAEAVVVEPVADKPATNSDPLADLSSLSAKPLTDEQLIAAEAEAKLARDTALDQAFSREGAEKSSGRERKERGGKKRLPRSAKSRDGMSDTALNGTRVVEVEDDKAEEGEELGGVDDAEEARASRSGFYRQYSIQEVLKRNQILLVQIIKEERGNKGASLTTYISLAGLYSVLMPNTDRSGGVSRRISDIKERKRLKSIVSKFDLDKGTSIIVRTAGVSKDEAEITRDYEYMKNLWETIRQNAVHSTAPALVHEEGNLIKRSLRDLYRSNIDEVLIEGEEAFNAAKSFIEAAAPDQAAQIKEYKGDKPIFTEYRIDEQLDELYDSEARLKSGGSIVINPTEALVSIDVNSGRATKEKSIEDTAVKTNIEAAYEVARQLRLRDLAGLVVIDFIDMRDNKNRRAVERALKDALKTDRAKIQVGRISVFGLMEMSRQRMRSSLVEASTQTCPRCQGTGLIRSETSTLVKLLRAIVAEAKKSDVDEVRMRTSTVSAMHLLNNKRAELNAIEVEHDVKVLIEYDNELIGSAFIIERPRKARGHSRKPRYNDNNVEDDAKEDSKDEAPKRQSNRNNNSARKPQNNKQSPKPAKKPEHKKVHTNKQDQATKPDRGNQAVVEVAESAVEDDLGNKAGVKTHENTAEQPKPQQQRRGRKTTTRKPAAHRQNTSTNDAGNSPNKASSTPASNDVSRTGEERSKLKGLWEKITQ